MYFTKFKIETNKKRSENIERLKQIVYTDKLPIIFSSFDFKGKPFWGTIKDNKFDIIPVIKGRNSFAPVIKGEVCEDDQSVIIVKMRLHLFVIAFIIFITVLILWVARNDMGNDGLIILPPIYLITTFLYLRESKKYKEKFESYFK